MKKILISLMTLVLVVGMVGAGAFAYFSDVETSEGNVFTAGTIDIEVSDDGGSTFENPWLRVDKVIAATAKPCEKYWDIIVVHNAGDNDLLLWKHIIGETSGGGPDLYNGYSSEPEWEACVVGGLCSDFLPEVVWYDLVIAVGDLDDPPGSVDDIILIKQGERTLGSMECEWIPLGPLAPSEVMVIAQSYHIDENAGNEYQGDTCSFTVEFYAEQLGGPGPPPGP